MSDQALVSVGDSLDEAIRGARADVARLKLVLRSLARYAEVEEDEPAAQAELVPQREERPQAAHVAPDVDPGARAAARRQEMLAEVRRAQLEAANLLAAATDEAESIRASARAELLAALTQGRPAPARAFTRLTDMDEVGSFRVANGAAGHPLVIVPTSDLPTDVTKLDTGPRSLPAPAGPAPVAARPSVIQALAAAAHFDVLLPLVAATIVLVVLLAWLG